MLLGEFKPRLNALKLGVTEDEGAVGLNIDIVNVHRGAGGSSARCIPRARNKNKPQFPPLKIDNSRPTSSSLTETEAEKKSP